MSWYFDWLLLAQNLPSMTPPLCDVMIWKSFLDSSQRIPGIISSLASVDCGLFLSSQFFDASTLSSTKTIRIIYAYAQKEPIKFHALARCYFLILFPSEAPGSGWRFYQLHMQGRATGVEFWRLSLGLGLMQNFWTGWPAGLQCRHSWSPEGHSKWCPSQVFPSKSGFHCPLSCKCCPVSPSTHVRLIWRQHWVCHIEWNIHIVNLSAFTLQFAYPQCPIFSVNAKMRFCNQTSINPLSFSWPSISLSWPVFESAKN